jgi:plasmid stabilization system protein ParE
VAYFNVRPLAWREINAQLDYLEEEAGLETAERFLERFRNYCGLIKVARSGFPWEKTTKGDVASVYTNCETALDQLIRSFEMLGHMPKMGALCPAGTCPSQILSLSTNPDPMH